MTPRLDFELRSRSQYRWVRGKWRSHMAETLQTLRSTMLEASLLIKTLNKANRFNGARDQEKHAHAAAMAMGLSHEIRSLRSLEDSRKAIDHAQPIIPLVTAAIHQLAPLSFDPETVQHAAGLQSTLAKMDREVRASIETRRALASARVQTEDGLVHPSKIRKAAL